MFDLNMLWWIIPSSFAASLVLWLLIDLLRLSSLRSRADGSFKVFCSAVPEVVFVTGPQGVGKTTLESGFVNFAVLKLMNMCQETCQRVRSVLYDIDFNPVNCLVSDFEKAGIYDSDRFIRKLYFLCPSLRERLKGTYDDWLQVSSLESQMSDYFYAFYALLKNNFVYCNQSSFFCRINSVYAQRAEPSIMEAKYCFSNHLKPMDLYSVFFDDDKIPSAKSTDSARIASEDRGFDLSLRFIRHLSKETWYYFTTAQSFSRVVKEQRELCLGEFSVQGRKEYTSYRLAVFFLSIFIDVIRWFQGLCVSVFKKQLRFIRQSSPQPFGKALYKATDLLCRLKANNYVRYEGTVYTSFDESGQHVAEGSSPFRFLIPSSFCYGSAERFGFSFLGDALRSSANRKEIKDPSLRKYASELLTPKKSKKEIIEESKSVPFVGKGGMF